MEWDWSQIEPYYAELASRPLDAASVDAWLAGWTRLSDLVSETYSRRYVARTLDTTDEKVERAYFNFLENIYPDAQRAEQDLKQLLLNSGLQVDGFEVPLRRMRVEAELYRDENLPLITEEQKLGAEYDKIIGAQTVEWGGKEVTLAQINNVYQEPERDLREKAWRLATERQLADREAINVVWGKFLELRLTMAANADEPDYRAYRWQLRHRFDYTPEDCISFHQAIEEVVVPAATRIYEKDRLKLGVDALRPWDMSRDYVYPPSRHTLKPYADIDALIGTTSKIFHKLDSTLGEYFDIMRKQDLLDLENRKGKAPGGYNTSFDNSKLPFIFMNAVGVHDDVQTMLHEAGHAFHVFERSGLPYSQQRDIGSEIAEVASMSMELLAAPYLAAEQGGFYSKEDAAYGRIQHLERIILFWPYMAVVDAFQHWVYTHPQDAADPANCDAQWTELWQRFVPGVDWSGLEEQQMTGWHRKLHIFRYPFYYVEYGLAQLGAVQVWSKSLQNQAQAVKDYREALALGATRPLPELFEAAGARLAFDADTLREAMSLVEKTIAKLEGA